MKIAVTGASGNVGTAVLRALQADETVSQIVGISRRTPPEVEPYAGVEWHSVDVGAAAGPDETITALTRAFEGVDAVIHLAWIIYPNHDRELLRRVNVEGTQRTLEACAAAGVPHIVVASSVGAYSADPARGEVTGPTDASPLRQEDFPARGIAGSHYSEDKGAVEELLDAFTAAHPEITLARLRPGLIFQPAAASEIKRFFLGSAAPVGLLDTVRPPLVPLPKGVRAQAVHADDIAEAYRLAATKRATGAFNICADDVLYPKDLAELVGQGRFVEVPPKLVRSALAAAHASGAVPADAGWVDMAMGVPLLDNSRAKRELGWAPTRTAKDTVRELISAMIEGAGHDSPSLWAENRPAAAPVVESAQVAGGVDADLLGAYLSDHIATAREAADILDAMTLDHQDSPVFAEIAAAAQQARTDRDVLEQLASALGVTPKTARAGQVKSAHRAPKRSRLALLLGTERLRAAAVATIGAWETLRTHAPDLGLEEAFLDTRIDATRALLDTLNEIHAHATLRAFRGASA
ncbi:NAD-dependent epimerase/dehydratase family protein [Corynebacterium auris]|uniref:NAD-dependent epimerase/dehydratase family protein n=1 Tax=Corynebacterium auris TaxID=44750 RepID=UPI0025B31F5D|nr:NAD-dependent epimerase/dehydratase family protein [Corynebacterium auris]WJY67457.1 NAD dependent epimerase/dehydratase family protein [Corynebacterium auris]